MNTKRIIITSLVGSIGLSVLSLSLSIAWYSSSENLYLDTLVINVSSSRDLYIATRPDEDVLTTSEDETDSEDEEYIAEEDGEDADNEETDGEDADSVDGNDSDTEDNEENGESDLNASMAEDNFDAEFYARTYPDVVAVFGDSAEALYKHYQDYGKAEGRSCNEEEFALLNETAN